MLFDPYPKLETERLTLRKMALTDRNDFFDMRSDPRLHSYTDTVPDETMEQTSGYLEKMLQGIAENRWIVWAIERKQTRRAIGSVGIWNIDEQKNTAELSYSITPDEQGKGLMKEALESVIDYAFDRLNLGALDAYTEENNLPSRKLLEGMRFQAVDRVDDIGGDGETVYHMIVYRRERL